MNNDPDTSASKVSCCRMRNDIPETTLSTNETKSYFGLSSSHQDIYLQVVKQRGNNKKLSTITRGFSSSSSLSETQYMLQECSPGIIVNTWQRTISQPVRHQSLHLDEHDMPSSSENLDQTPATNLTTFLRSSAIMHPQPPLYAHASDSNIDQNATAQQPHEVLAVLFDDERWTRRMLEDWFKQGTMSERGGSVTPNPELRAVYLIILNRMIKRENERAVVAGNGEEKDSGTAAAKVEKNLNIEVMVDSDGFEKAEWLK